MYSCTVSRMSTPLRLDLRHYETVVAIVDCGSMTDAARRQSITQSAMSHRLAEAERRIGVTLFERGADRRLTPTTHGVAVHQSATRALDELRRLEDALIAAPAGVTATVRIGVGGYEAFHWYPRFLTDVRTTHPHLDLDLLAVGDNPGAALAARTVDLVLAPGEPNGDHRLVPAFDDELVFVCAPDHPLASAPVIEPEALGGETYLTYNALPSPGFEYDRFVRLSSHAPRIVRVVRQTSAIVELVAAGVGVSILSRWATEPAVRDGRLVAIRCGAGALPIAWHTAHRRGDTNAAAVAEQLGEHLRSRSVAP